MFDTNLARSINGGRCFLLLGSGPSCELGLPSWHRLAELILERVLRDVPSPDAKTYNKYITNKQYPELLRQAEIDLGGRHKLADAVRQLLTRDPARSSDTYTLLTKWPFPVYLTTNFDDEIHTHLTKHGLHYATLSNTQAETGQVRADSSHLVYKLHGDLRAPDTAVLTSLDYADMRSGPAKLHIRQKLTAIFTMCDVFIVGHSLADPDLQLILETAKLTANPSKPVYMALANTTPGEVRDLRERYNIQVIPYNDKDHSHSELRRILRAADRFVCKRGFIPAALAAADEAEIEAATSLLLYRQTAAAVDDGDVAHDILIPLVLRTLRHSLRPPDRQALTAARPLALLCGNNQRANQLTAALSRMVEAKQLHAMPDGTFVLTSRGVVESDALAAARTVQRDQAFGQFALDLRTLFPPLTGQEEEQARDAFTRCL